MKGAGEAWGGGDPRDSYCRRKVSVQVTDPQREFSSQAVIGGFSCSGIQRPWSQVEVGEARRIGKEVEFVLIS